MKADTGSLPLFPSAPAAESLAVQPNLELRVK